MKFAKTMLAAMAMIGATTAQAATVTIPSGGASGSFEWTNGLGAIDAINGIGALDSATFGLTANAGDTVDVYLYDCCVPGDQFALVLNGSTLTPTTTTPGTYTYFFDDVVLAGGENIFGINVTALADGFTTGGGSYAFDAVAPGVPGAVPEPGTWAMMLLGFGAIGSAMRRRHTALRAALA